MPRSARARQRPGRRSLLGFTLMELVVVMTLIGLLLTVALPRYLDALDRGKEKVLERNLTLMREAIDRYYGDTGKYPDRLEDLVAKRYLRAIPPDPFLEAPTWVVVAPSDLTLGGVIDVDSTGSDRDGRPRKNANAGDGTGSAQPVANGARITVTVSQQPDFER
ncbi:type II secretion system protein [Leptothrix sp. BB-4]